MDHLAAGKLIDFLKHKDKIERLMSSERNVKYLCQRCGNCCRWPGFIRLAPGEAEKIADYMGLELAEFTERYTVLLPNRQGLGIRSQEDHACVFLRGHNECTIQKVKPEHCRGFPNAWRFPGWREKCEAIELEEI